MNIAGKSRSQRLLVDMENVYLCDADALQTQHSVTHPTPLQRRRTFISPAPPPRTRVPLISGFPFPSSSLPMSQPSAPAQAPITTPIRPSPPLPFQTVLHTWNNGLA
ncbi:hypothetical protein H2248_012257 [Termitomyces sp. 'cryptogamus']|nr:hypothetical protein H2248_012257 [Termitomyces sp. 'cryptogamus']